MSRRRSFTVSLFGLMAISVSLLLFKQTQNTRTEQARRAHLTLNDADQTGDSARGEIVARVGGCIACHTDVQNGGALLAGGVRLETPFGTFVSPNISSDPVTGIGAWNVHMLAEAVLNGRRPDGGHYWPAFPYPAYAAMNQQDIVDLHAWLQSSEPIADAAPGHELRVPDIARAGLGVWKSLYVPDDYVPGVFVERGEYLVEGPGHCASCHAPRDLAGGVSDRRLTGNSRGPEGGQVPAITVEALKDWSIEDLMFYLEIGMTPEGDFSGGHMAAVIEQGTAYLPTSDLNAMAIYLKSPANQERR